MGKKKFDKSNSVTFKLVYRDGDDQENADKTLSERIFSVIEADKKRAVQENDKVRQKILSQFTNEELGKAPPKAAKNIQKETVSHKDNISSHTKGRNDLWITHLTRMKQQAKAEVDMEEEEKEEQTKREKMLALLKKKQATKKTVKKETKKEEEEEDEDEEWESCDEEDEEGDEEEEEDEQVEIEEWEEEEEYEDEEENEKEENKKDIVYKTIIEGKGRQDDIVQCAAPVIPVDDFPTLGSAMPEEFVKVEIPEIVKTKEQIEEEKAEEEINLKKIKVVGDVKLKRYDNMGLPIDGYNYYQHVVDPNAGGAPNFSFTVQYDQLQILPEDNDFRNQKMNAEEKELYEALEYTENPGYEEIEDDFFTQLTKENKVAVEEDDGKNTQANKKVTFKNDDEIKEILMSKDEPKDDSKKGKDSVLQRNDFQKVLQQHVDLLKNKYKEERARNKAKFGLPQESDEEEEVEEVESFDEDDENNRPKEYVEKLSYKDDFAMQQAMAESENDENEDDDEQYEREISKNNLPKTQPTSEHVSVVGVTKTKLNIIKESTGKQQKEGNEAKKQSEADDKEEKEEDEDEDEEENGNRIEEVFKKRERGETKEERKERKELVKQFKQERKEKKKTFKENFEDKKKAHIETTKRQVSKLQGYSIYKLTV